MSDTTSVGDFKVAAMAFGFSLGFGFLTTWGVVKATMVNRNPLRSAFIYMLWGEVIANLGMAIMGWIWIDEVVPSDVPTLFFVLFFWVFQVQLLMQIIINRIAIIAEHRSTVTMLKWITATIMTCINIAVFCIFIPAHREPPVSQLYVDINKYWDRTSKFLIMGIDAVLNWYFLKTVNNRLLKQHNLKKYQPLVTFNMRLMALSIALDAMLIGLMWLPNGRVFIQFHPVTYLAKLNIEMSMAKLITRLASKGASDEFWPEASNSNGPSGTGPSGTGPSGNQSQIDRSPWAHHNHEMVPMSKVMANDSDEEGMRQNGMPGGIQRRTEIEVKVESDRRQRGRHNGEDELPLTSDTGHPKPGTVVEEVHRAASSLTSRDS